MGKVDDMRAMREARYAARTAAATPAAKAVKARKVLENAETPAPTGELCGHQSISKKRCTREKDHQLTGTKNHRYS